MSNIAMKWRLISTAPKNPEQAILTWRECTDENGGEVNITYWIDCSDGTGFWEGDGCFEISPTHWMPMPPPPNVQNE